MLNLEAKTDNEKKILGYLEENASDALREKINNGKKTLKDCWNYIVSEAKRLARTGNCVVVEDSTVYGWAIHFFEEDSIKPSKTTGPVRESLETPKKAKMTKNSTAESVKNKKKDMFESSQISFDF